MNIQYIDGLTNHIILPKDKFDTIPLRIILIIGAYKKEVKVKASEDISLDTIGLSEDLKGWCRLPEDLPYDVRFNERSILIGPVIAFLPVTYKKSFTDDTLAKLQKYYISYDDIKGLMYTCSVEGINTSNKTIEGIYYNPKISTWIEGIFPYPGALFKRADFSKPIYDDLLANMGDNIFNTYFFNKWDLWECLSQYPDINQYLPFTAKLTSLSDLDEMLNKCNSVYLKRISGFKAKGIIKVEKLGDKYKFIYRLSGEKLLDVDDARKFIDELISNTPYLIQESIKVKNCENRSFDFRLILQKGQSKKWDCTGAIARFGAVNSIATNFLLEGYALSGKEALMKVFDIGEKEAFIKLEEIKDACITTCTMLDKTLGHYGDLGIDVMLDECKRLWILEINKLHDHKYPLYSLNDTQMYHNVITNPFRYAKALAGFK